MTPASDEVKDGFYLSPCVITDTNDSMRVVREEIFGAVLIIIPFDTEEEVIERTNNTNFGLAAGLFSRQVFFSLFSSPSSQIYFFFCFQ